MGKTTNMTVHQQPLPPDLLPIIKDREHVQSLCSCLCPSLNLVLSAILRPLRIPTAPCGNEGHIAFWEKHAAMIPFGPSPPDNLAQSPPKISWPLGHRATQNNRTHQHFHLHPRASSDTAAAAVRPLTGTDRVLKSTKAL